VGAVAYSSVLPLDFFDDAGLSYESRRRSAVERRGAAADGIAGGQLDVFLHARFARSSRDARSIATNKRGSPSVCIVNEAFARSLGGRPAVGRRVAYRPASSPQDKPSECEIVGVARQVKGRPDEAKDFVQLYVPLAQDLSDDVFLVVRPTAGRAEGLTAAVRAPSPASTETAAGQRTPTSGRSTTSRRAATRPSVGFRPCWWSAFAAWRSSWQWSECSGFSRFGFSSTCVISASAGARRHDE